MAANEPNMASQNTSADICASRTSGRRSRSSRTSGAGARSSQRTQSVSTTALDASSPSVGPESQPHRVLSASASRPHPRPAPSSTAPPTSNGSFVRATAGVGGSTNGTTASALAAKATAIQNATR